MKTTISNNLPTQFPKLQKAINGNIFLMTSPSSGTCVHDTSKTMFLGIHFTNLDPTDLVDFKDTLLLEN